MNRRAEGERGADEAYAKNKSNALLSYLLDCVRRGSCSDIEAALSDPEYPRLTQLMVGNDLSFAHKVFQYLSPQIVRAAVDGGMSWMAAVGIYHNYTKKAQQARLVPALLELYNQMFLDFADNAARAKEDYHFSPLVRQFRNKYIGYSGSSLHKRSGILGN